MRLDPIPLKNQVRNFAFSQDRPFSVQHAADETGIKKKTVRRYLSDLEKSKFVRRVNGSKKLYYILNRSDRAGPAAELVLEAINEDKTSLRQIAGYIGVSHEFIRPYVNSMLHEGRIGYNGQGKLQELPVPIPVKLSHREYLLQVQKLIKLRRRLLNVLSKWKDRKQRLEAGSVIYGRRTI